MSTALFPPSTKRKKPLSGDVRDQLTTPIIYSIILPFVLLDIWVSFR